jgi:hypothetical protein
MRRYLILAPLLLAAAPASAQFWPGPMMAGPSGRSMACDFRTAETAQIVSNINKGRRGDQLTRREARLLKREAYQIDVLEARYAAGGLSPAEEAELFVRREALRNDVTAKRTGARK